MSIPEKGIADPQCSYVICCGPFQFKRQTSFNTGIANLETVLKCLKRPEQADVEGTWKIVNFLQAAKAETSAKITRLMNLLFGTGEWYNENYARKMIKNFIALPEEQKILEARKQLLEIYESLKYASENDTNYVKGISEEDLLQETEEVDLMATLLALASEAMPEPEVIKGIAKSLITTGAKFAGKAALEAAGSFFGGPVGAKVVPLVGIKLAKITKVVINSIAKTYSLDLTDPKQVKEIEGKKAPKPVACRDIVLYKP